MADNDNGEGMPDRKGGAVGHSDGRLVLRLASSRKDQHADNLEKLTNEAFGLASETLRWIKMEDYDSPARELLVRQGGTLVGCYTKLLAASERHRKAMREET